MATLLEAKERSRAKHLAQSGTSPPPPPTTTAMYCTPLPAVVATGWRFMTFAHQVSRPGCKSFIL